MTTGRSVVDLRVLVAHEQEHAAGVLERTLTSGGFRVVAATAVLEEALDALARAPDLALVGFVDRRADALVMIEALAAKRACPVLAVVPASPDDYAMRASEFGAWGVLGEPELLDRLPACAAVARRRFAEHRDLGAALDRRIVIERATGILMERHGVDGPTGFAMLRTHARGANAKVFDIAGAVIQGHALLPASEI